MSDAQEPDHPGLPHTPGPSRVAPGLHLVATPIGAARDITLRALDILTGADVLAAEDTRSLRRLMEIHGIPVRGRPVLAYHDHNGAQVRPRLLAALAEGKSVAFAPEAGTPMVSDPGYQLARAATEAGYSVVAAPGASAVLTALTVGGLPTDRFCFMGFPPQQGAARKRMLAEAAAIPATLAFYESPKRIHRLLGEIGESLGTGRDCALCRELTKRFEEVIRGTVADVTAAIEGRDLKGEIVLLVGRASDVEVGEADLDRALHRALEGARVKDAATQVAEALGLPRRQVYQRALELSRAEEDDR
ncbi:MAG: 16S rRNA (cytidine(1402)-2'-O)-methyltransferase [Rhodobacter sp.]|nr:16S rRNA (cytidine(1402)-2'-O)-methyltransferase [Paracoccaceae bacterium]MCC0076064.1 16S rRNA (cytidine(1402)-2'-O)-methyltransferase [Rhodobacter sp.]